MDSRVSTMARRMVHFLPLTTHLKDIIQWCYSSDFPDGFQIYWTETQLETVLNYLSDLEVDSDFSFRMHMKLCRSDVWHDRYEHRNYGRCADVVLSFLQDLGELFNVPTLQQLSHKDNTLERNQLVAGFISFLVQLLHPHPYFFALYKFPVVENQVVGELRFLITILGDAPFQATEHEKVGSLLDEFEQVANEAGALVHAIIFDSDVSITTMNEAFAYLLKHIQYLKANIMDFLDLPNIVVTPSANHGMGSLFIVGSLLRDLEELMNREDNVIVDIKDQIKIFHQRLTLCQSLLKAQHVENEELKNEPVVQIINVSYDAEYLINSFVVGDAPLWYVARRLTHLTCKMELVETRLQEMKKDYDIEAEELVENLGAQLSLLDEKDSGNDDIFVGFEQLETDILDQLVGGTRHRQSILIFGMAGIGKTTLARKLHNHPLVRYHFDKICWCVVSQTYQKKKLLSDILIILESRYDSTMISGMDEGDLAQHVYQNLKGWRYLIVLDDLWNSNVWDDLRIHFPNDGNGSSILFTSRNKDVAPMGCIIHELPFLSTEQCWKLLEKKIFCNEPCPHWLHCIGKEIAAKCYGLPLVVVVIAGILSTMGLKKSAWTIVRDNIDSYMLSDKSNSVRQILGLSYKYLPSHLKPCFLYFGLYEEDERISSKELKWRWAAEGFIHEEEKRRAESVAENYLTELIGKSLVMVVEKRSDGGAKVCVIHDLVHNICLQMAKKEKFLKSVVDHDNLLWNQKDHRVRVRMDPSVVCPSKSNCLIIPYGPQIRSFSGSLLNSSLSVLNMKLLKVLCCRTRSSYHDLFGIELLVHLRYLDIDHMVSSICYLVNLEILIVRCDRVCLSSLLQMVKLRYVKAMRVCIDEYYEVDVFRPTNLEFLSYVEIRKQEDVERLRKYAPNLRRLKGVYCASKGKDGTFSCLDFSVLPQLESLTLKCFYIRLDCPIRIESITNVKKLNLEGVYLRSSKEMSIIGLLPNLEVLKLENVEFESGCWETRDGEFKQLRCLHLKWLTYWRQWNVSSSEDFPKLQQLVVDECIELVEIPCVMGEIATLQAIELHGANQESLVESVMQIQELQREWGNQHFTVILMVNRGGLNRRATSIDNWPWAAWILLDKYLVDIREHSTLTSEDKISSASVIIAARLTDNFGTSYTTEDVKSKICFMWSRYLRVVNFCRIPGLCYDDTLRVLEAMQKETPSDRDLRLLGEGNIKLLTKLFATEATAPTMDHLSHNIQTIASIRGDLQSF